MGQDGKGAWRRRFWRLVLKADTGPGGEVREGRAEASRDMLRGLCDGL